MIPYRYFGLLLAVSALYGEPVQTIDELITSALKSHPIISSSKQAVAGAEADVEGAKWGYYPTPSVEYSQASGKNAVTLRLDQPIWTGGKLDAAVNAAESRKAESQSTLSETSFSLVSDLFAYYRNYLQAQGSIQALEEGKNQLLELKSMLDRRIEAGVSSLSDGELIRSRLSQIDTDLAAARTNRSLALYQIEILSGVKIPAESTAIRSSYSKQSDSPDELVQAMLKTHPSLKKIDAQIKQAEAERDRAKAAVWPNVSLRAEHQNGSVYYDNTVTNNVVYVALSASPGAGLSALSSIQSSESALMKKQFEKQAKEKELIDALMRIYNDYHMAKERLEGTAQTIDASEKVLESYKRLFIAGKRQWLDLVNSSREVTQNKLSQAELKALLESSACLLALEQGKINLTPGESL